MKGGAAEKASKRLFRISAAGLVLAKVTAINKKYALINQKTRGAG
jgi:hypothetical protein